MLKYLLFNITAESQMRLKIMWTKHQRNLYALKWELMPLRMVRRLNPRNLENIYISPRLAAAAASSLHIYIKKQKNSFNFIFLCQLFCVCACIFCYGCEIRFSCAL